MLVGSGGVVALVIGAWGVLWALRRTPGRQLRTWYPELVALVGGMYGSALLTAHATVVLGVLGWVRAAPLERPMIAAETLASVPRPLAAATIGLLTVGAVVMALRSRTPVVPDAAVAPLRWSDLLLSGCVVGSTILGLVVALAMRVEAEAAMTTLRAANASAPLLQGLTLVGTVAVAVDLTAAAVLAVVTTRRG